MNEIIVQGSRIIVDNTLQELESYLPEGKKVIIITEEQIIRHQHHRGRREQDLTDHSRTHLPLA